MPTEALGQWQSGSRARIQQLLDAHAAMSKPGPGRNWRTEQINWSLVLLIAAEFQRYCRGLHDVASDHFSTQVGQLNAPLASVMLVQLTTGRKLDRGNASPGALGADFGRFGIALWPDLEATHGVKAERWNKQLEALNTARNGLAHADVAKTDKLKAEGLPLSQLRTIKTFQRAADGMTNALDSVVGTYLQRLLGGHQPW